MSRLPPLVSPDWLAERLGAPGLRVLDIRSGPEAEADFAAARIPGAVRADYVTAGWRAQEGAAPGMLPPAHRLATLLGGLGIAPATDVVIASAGDLSTSARVYWTLKSAGHSRVALLDGGMAAWLSAGLPTEAGAAVPEAASDYPVRIDETWRARREAVEAALASGGALIDARGAGDFAGETKSPHAARAGRLPGAIHLDQSLLVDPATKRLRPPGELAALAAACPEGPAVTYCNTGQAAAGDWFVLSEILGRPGITLYDGSMSEWTQDPERPVETGRPA